MSSPGTHIFRLPTEAQAQAIILNANGKSDQSEEVKTLRNLYKALDWAYKGLSATDKTSVRARYPNIEADLQAEISGKAKSLNAVQVLRDLVAVMPELQHSGPVRLTAFNDLQKQIITGVIARLEAHVQEIVDGAHDDLIKIVFPGDAGYFSSTPPPLREVKDTFQLALAAVKQLDAQGKIQLDAYAKAIKTGGLTNPDEMKLDPDFFAATKTPESREAILGHESTHAINGAQRTNDEAGYLGSQKFVGATSAERLKNAAHFEAVIRLINDEELPQVAKDPGGAEKEAKEVVRRAWDKALNLYGMIHEYRTHNGGLVSDAGQVSAVMDISQLFGLPAYKAATHDRKTGARPAQVQLSDTDLAFMENRVGKLGVLLGAVSRAAAEVRQNSRISYFVTSREILEKLVEMEGPIRKTKNNAKTVDMILTLADLNQKSTQKFFETKY